MSDTPPSLPPPQPEPGPDPAFRTSRTTRDYLPWLYVLGFVVLAAAMVWLWRNPVPPAQPAIAPEVAQHFKNLDQEVAQVNQRMVQTAQQQSQVGQRQDQLSQQQTQSLQQLTKINERLASIDQRVAKIENQPAPAPPPAPDLQPLFARIEALEKREIPKPSPPVDLKPLEARIAALEQKPPPPPVDLKPLEARIAALEQKPPPPPGVTPAELGSLSARVDQIAGRLDAIAAHEASMDASFDTRLHSDEQKMTGTEHSLSQLADAVPVIAKKIDDLTKQFSGMQQSATEVSSIADKAAKLSRIQAAQAALDSGQKLGEVPGAPPSVAKFANTPPPTVYELRQSFNEAAEKALAAGQPAGNENESVYSRLWSQAQSMVTIRQGTNLVMGSPVTGVISQAREALDAGDLAGAVTALRALKGPPADAMAGWISQAQAVLDARAALSAMAAHV